MARRLRYSKGVGSIEITGPAKEIALAILEKAEPEIMKAREKELLIREKYAKARWPTRQKRYGKSSKSKQKFTRLIRVIPPNTIEAVLTNKAPYAWAIKAGRESNTPVKAGKRVANVLMWLPAKKSAKAIAEKLANAAIKPLKRVK